MTHSLFQPGGETPLRLLLVVALTAYVLMMALPFVPAAEIGMGLMLMFGPQVAILVYASTVFALLLAYLAGRSIQPDICAAAFAALGFRGAHRLVLDLAELDPDARLAFLLSRAPGRIAPLLLRRRHVALGLAFNCPGNTLLGGGGGIALAAGMSALYSLPAYLTTVAVSVAPIPVFIACSKLLLR